MNQQFLATIGGAILSSKLAQTISHLSADDLLCSVGLARRSNKTLESVGLIGLGVLIGGGAALLLAPTNGEEARQRLSEGFAKANEFGKDLARKAQERAPELVNEARAKIEEFHGTKPSYQS